MNLTDDRAHAALFRAIAEGRARIDIDTVRVRHVDCPVSGAAYHTLQIYLSGALGVAAIFLLPAARAYASIAGLVLLNLVVARPIVERSMRRHVFDRLSRRVDLWDRMWRFGGVTLRFPDGMVESAPAGDWRRAARRALEEEASGERSDRIRERE